MTRVAVQRVPRGTSKADALETDLQRARILAKLLDSQFQLGGIRFGLEGILGVIPVAGDALGGLLGLYPVWLARKHKLPKSVAAKMVANLGVEIAGGAIPQLGALFDVAVRDHFRR